ncbi:MAG: 3D domain-containing protein [bacterium]
MPRHLFRKLKDLVQLTKGVNFEIFSQESEHLRCGGKKRRKNNNFSLKNSHAKGEIVDIDPLPSLPLLNKNQSGRGFCFNEISMGNDDFSSPSDDFLKFNTSHKSSLTILLLVILFFEMIMPHKIFAMEISHVNRQRGVKYQFTELALSSDVYVFNDRYVPEEIELQKIAAKRAKVSDFEVLEVKTVTTTAYSSTVDQCDSSPFIAASGRRVHDGMVAANFLPFDTKIRMPEIFGDKIFVVEDRMNRRFQNRVDIWMESREKALRYGIRNVNIEILEEGNQKSEIRN